MGSRVRLEAWLSCSSGLHFILVWGMYIGIQVKGGLLLLLKPLIIFFKKLFYMYECLSECVRVYHMCAVTVVARRRSLVSWNWSYR